MTAVLVLVVMSSPHPTKEANGLAAIPGGRGGTCMMVIFVELLEEAPEETDLFYLFKDLLI